LLKTTPAENSIKKKRPQKSQSRKRKIGALVSRLSLTISWPPFKKVFFHPIAILKLHWNREPNEKVSDYIQNDDSASPIDFSRSIESSPSRFEGKKSKEEITSRVGAKNKEKDLGLESREVCFICCEIEANSVFFPCGHGGTCWDCAKSVWKKSGSCHICKQVIFKIYFLMIFY
jgi:Zinc finger, C3HC4 type (RING finger)